MDKLEIKNSKGESFILCKSTLNQDERFLHTESNFTFTYIEYPNFG